ncbi:MAG: secretin N-terminal domain-containing protein [Planctomycetota bacterium]
MLEKQRAIVIEASDEDFEVISKFVLALDEAAAGAKKEVRVFSLVNASNTRVAEALKDMYAAAVRRDIPEDVVSVVAITQTNAVVVTAAPEKMDEIAHLIKQLDAEGVAPQLEFRIYPLEHAMPTKILPALQQMLAQVEKMRPGEPIDVQADERTRSVIVTAKGNVFEQIEKIVKSLDEPPAAPEAEILIIPLKRADAKALADVLNEMLRPSGETQVTPEARALQEQVRRLRVRSTTGREIPELDLTKPIKIQADPAQPQGSNALVITSTADNLKALEAIVEVMDVAPIIEGVKVRILLLQHADAANVMKTLQEVFEQGLKLAGKQGTSVAGKAVPETTSGKALVHQFNVSADVRTNALIISGLEESIALAELIVKNLDVEQPFDMAEIRLIPLQNADAAALADTLQKMMDARVERQKALEIRDPDALRMLILPDERSNSLIVGGSLEGFKLIESIAARLDSASPALGGRIQLFALKMANSGTLSQTLSKFFEERYASARTEELRRQKPIILPDLRTNSLLVAANADDTAVLKSLLKKLDVELGEPAVRLVVIPLQHNDAGVVGPTIEKIFDARLKSMTPPGADEAPQDRVDVATDALSNALVISASKENLEMIRRLLKKVDIEPPVETGIVRMYPLENSDAQRITTMLESLFDKGLYKPGLLAAGASEALKAREKVAIAVDVRTNVLVVSASKENFAVIDEIIKRVDAEEDFGLLGGIRLFQLQNADSTKLAPTLQQFFDAKRQSEEQTGGAGRSLAVNIFADGRTNTLLVAGSRESFKAVEAMIERLDGTKAPPASDFRIFYLKQATAAALEPTLQKLFDQRVDRGDTKETVTIIADAKSNALIIGATGDDLAAAESLIAQLDVAHPTPGTITQVFPLLKADAIQVSETIKDLYKAQGEKAAEGIGISVDERINALVVSGGAADLKRIAELIDQLDASPPTNISGIRVFALQNADAKELATILTDTLTQKPAPMAGESGNRQAILQFVTRTSDGKELISEALAEGVLFTPDSRTNSLVVLAPLRNMPLLETLIMALDSASPRMAEIRVFKLVNADALRMADVLKELFRLKNTSPESMKSVKYTMVGNEQPGGASATVGTAEQYTLSITVDARTNSLLVGGTKQYVELVEGIIQELDASPAQERITKVIRLRNAKAGDIETALKEFLDQERQKLVSTLGDDAVGAAQRLLEHEVVVVSVASDGEAEKASMLLMSASPRYYEVVGDIIDELDQPPPQVLIQVLLAEVSLDDSTDLGMDWSVIGNPRSSTTVDVGTSFGVEAEISQAGGFSVQVTGGDLGLFMRALQSQSRIELLSRPQILASDNQEAEISIGERVPFITSSVVSEEGTSTFNTVQYEKVGIILKVTPRINPDGFVRLQVRPEISSIAESTVQITEGVDAIVVNSRVAETTVTVQDGHTIIIGGLITTDDQEIVDKIPFLGDIPGLGWLFKSTTWIEDRRELLIILTPHVMRTIADADAETDRQFKRLRLLGEIEKEDVLKKEALRPIVEHEENSIEPLPVPPLVEPRQRPVPLYLLPEYQKLHSPHGDPRTR